MHANSLGVFSVLYCKVRAQSAGRCREYTEVTNLGPARCRISALGPLLGVARLWDRTCVPGLGTHVNFFVAPSVTRGGLTGWLATASLSVGSRTHCAACVRYVHHGGAGACSHSPNRYAKRVVWQLSD